MNAFAGSLRSGQTAALRLHGDRSYDMTMVADEHGSSVMAVVSKAILEKQAKRASQLLAVSNQSTGYCPDVRCWPAVATALERAGLAHPGRFTTAIIFRRCPACGERNLVKDDHYVCALCDAELPAAWNF